MSSVINTQAVHTSYISCFLYQFTTGCSDSKVNYSGELVEMSY